VELQLHLRLTGIEAARSKLPADHKDEIATEAVARLRAELDLMAQQIRITMGER
jgi:monovalent cation/hydrogen antiporter